MAITEESRHRLYERLEELLGRDETATLMEHLPPVGWADVATKRDLDQLAAMTKRDLDEHRVMTKRDLDDHRATTKRDLDELAATTKRDLDHGLETLGNVLRVEFAREQRHLTFAMLAANSTLAAIAFGAASLV